MIEDEFHAWDENFEKGFESMVESVRENDFGGFADGLDRIMQVFNSEAMFHNVEEVEEFLFDDSSAFEF